jgi:hypothetical protein
MEHRRGLVGLAMLATLLSGVPRARAHCDTLDGPVVKDARTALEAGDPTLALRWVGHAGESVEKGRAFVASYVELMHYAERLLEAATTDAGHARHETEGASSVRESHRH